MTSHIDIHTWNRYMKQKCKRQNLYNKFQNIEKYQVQTDEDERTFKPSFKKLSFEHTHSKSIKTYCEYGALLKFMFYLHKFNLKDKGNE